MVNYEGWGDVLDGNGVILTSTPSQYEVINSDETRTLYISATNNISFNQLGVISGGTITEIRRLDSAGNVLVSATVNNIALTAIVPDILSVDLFEYINQVAPVNWEFNLVTPGDAYDPVTTATSIILNNVSGGTTVITGANFNVQNDINGSVYKIEQFDANGNLISSLTNIPGLPLLNIVAALLPAIAPELAVQVMFEGNNTFAVQAGGHSISGANGDDTITGGGEDDVLYGGGGHDTLSGGAGNDVLVGDETDQQFGNDSLEGGAGNDRLDGGNGEDTAIYVNDTSGVTASLVSNTATSLDSGNDDFVSIENLTGGTGNDKLTGDDGINVIKGNDGGDVIVLNGGDDVGYGGNGFDWIYGGDGNDTLYGGAGSTDVLLGNNGNDTLYGNDGFDYLYGYADNDTIYGGNGVDVAYGGDGNDTIYGEAETDWLFGGAGNDTISGGTSADLVIGEAGNDIIMGGDGNDWLWGDAITRAGGGGADIFKFEGNWGIDVVYDFENGIDHIDLSNTSVGSFSNLTIGQIAGGFTWIASADGNVIYLASALGQTLTASDLTAEDFIF